MMKSFFFVLLAWFLELGAVSCNNYNVGEQDGWVVCPKENYTQWSQRNTFHVNDTLVFRYKEGEDSVLQVKQDGYEVCNTKKSIKAMRSGQSVFVLDNITTFYFISGRKHHCLQGQKLLVNVVAAPQPPASVPVTPTPAVSPSPSLPPQPGGGVPAPAPAPAPAAAASWVVNAPSTCLMFGFSVFFAMFA